MIIHIDTRENDLLINMNLLFKEHSHEIITKQLPLGDIILLDNKENEKIIFERKSLYDLAASIKDGRYNEQSFRLNEYSCHNHNIIYIIEGDFDKYNPIKGRIDKKTLYSALITLNYYKGFSVFKTKSMNETCELIINYADKLQKDTTRESFYGGGEKKEINYSQVLKMQKKNNITVENIGEIMLSNIPSVSNKTAIHIMREFKSIKNLICEMEKNKDCLQNIKIVSESGQSRKISSKCVDNIKKYLLNQEDIIHIDCTNE